MEILLQIVTTFSDHCPTKPKAIILLKPEATKWKSGMEIDPSNDRIKGSN